MPSSYRPVIDGNDNVIAFDTFNSSGQLVRRFATEEEADAACVEHDTPYKSQLGKSKTPGAPDPS